METAKITKGSWDVIADTKTNPLKFIITNQPNADITDTRGYFAEVEANRKLIAAAPELLEALLLVAEELKRKGESPLLLTDVENAIQKATE